MTGRDFNDRYVPNRRQEMRRSGSSGRSGGLTPRDTSYIITPEDATEKATSNVSDATRLIGQYGDLLSASETADLENIVASGGAPPADLKMGALQAFGRLAETFDRPFQVIRHTAAGIVSPELTLNPRDYADIMAGNDAALIERHGVDAVGKHGDTGGSQILKLLGVEEAETGGGKAARFVGALAIEVALDPMTWFTGGFSGVGKKAALESLEKTTGAAVASAVKKVSREGAEGVLESKADDAVRALDDMIGEGATELDRMMLRDGTQELRSRIQRGDVAEQVGYIKAIEMTPEEQAAKLRGLWLDEVDHSFGVNRTGGTIEDGVAIPGAEWGRVTKQLDTATGGMVDMPSPFNILAKRDEQLTWYGKIQNELSDVIGNKKFNNPDGYKTWDAYLDHVNAGNGDIWTTGGITFGFGKWQTEVPFLTSGTRGKMAQVTRPVLSKLQKGPAYQRWIKWRQGWSREGTQMLLAARSLSDDGASYAEWQFVRSTAALTANHVGLISSLYRASELDRAYIHMTKDLLKGVPKKEREAALEGIGAAFSNAIGRNDLKLNLEHLPDNVQALFTPEVREAFDVEIRAYADLIHDAYTRAQQVIPEIRGMGTNRSAYTPVIGREGIADQIEEMFFGGSFRIDVQELVESSRVRTAYKEGKGVNAKVPKGVGGEGEDLGQWFARLTDWGRANGYLGPDEVFYLDHLYHLVSLADSGDAKGAAATLGEKAATRMRTFVAGGALIYTEIDPKTGKHALGVERAFGDQAHWSRQLAGLMHAINEVHDLRFKLDFEDVLETNPMIKMNTYLGQLQEVVLQKVALAETKKMGRAARASHRWDAGQLIALGAGHDGFYTRLSIFLDQLADVHGALVHYRDVIGTPKVTKIGGFQFYFPRQLTDNLQFTQIRDQWDERIGKLGGSATERQGKTAKRVKQVQGETPGMTEAEAFVHVQAEVGKEVAELHERSVATVRRLIREAFEDTAEVIERHPETVPQEVLIKLSAAHDQAVQDASTEVHRLVGAYVSKAMGGEAPPMSVVELTPDAFNDVIQEIVGTGSADAMRLQADMLKSFHESLSALHPTKARAEMEEKLYRKAAELQAAFEGDGIKIAPTVELWAGFQGGVDRAALRVAFEAKMGTGGFAPTGFRTDEGVGIPELIAQAQEMGVRELDAATFREVFKREPGARELEGYAARTVVNIVKTDGTVVVFPGAGRGGKGGWGDSGTIGTIAYAARGPAKDGKLPKDYSLEDFHEDFYEAATGLWLPREEAAMHKPIIVVSYLEDVLGAEGKLKGPAVVSEGSFINDELTAWLRRNNVQRVNLAGPRFRKEIEPEFISERLRYGATMKTMRDPVTGEPVPATVIHVKPRYEPGFAISPELTPDQAEEMYFGAIRPIMGMRTPELRLGRIQIELARVQLAMQGAEGGAAEALGNEAATYRQIAALIEEGKITDEWLVRRPVLVPNTERPLNLDEAIEATQLMLSETDGMDVQKWDMTIGEMSKYYKIDPYEMMMANRSEASLRGNLATETLESGAQRPRALESVYKILAEEIRKKNLTRKAIHDGKQLAAGVKEDSKDWVPFSPVVFDQNAISAVMAQEVKNAGHAPGSAEAIALERELVIDRYVVKFGRDESLYEYSNRVVLEGTKFQGLQRPPMREIKDIDIDGAWRLISVFNSDEVQQAIVKSGINIDDLLGVTDDELVQTPEFLDRMFQVVQQLQNPDALTDPSAAIILPRHLQPRLPVNRSEIDYQTVLWDQAELEAAHAADGAEKRRLLAEAFTNGTDRYEREVREVAEMHGWSDAQTAPLVSLPGPEGVVTPGLWQRLMDNPPTAAEIRRIGAQSATEARIVRYGSIAEEVLADLYGSEQTPNGRVYYAIGEVTQQAEIPQPRRRLEPAEVTAKIAAIDQATEDYKTLVAKLQTFVESGASTGEADRWLVQELGIPIENLQAARRRGQEAIDPLDDGEISTYSAVLEEWLTRKHPQLLEDYGAGRDLDYLPDWLRKNHPTLVGNFENWRKRRSLDLEAQTLAEEEGLADLGPQGASITGWDMWIVDAWEAMQRRNGLQEQEAFELLHFFKGKFGEDPGVASVARTPDELAGRVDPAAPSPGHDFAKDRLDDSQLDEVLGIQEGIGRETRARRGDDLGVAYDISDDKFIAESGQGKLVSDFDKLYVHETLGPGIIFPAGGRIRTPAQRMPKKHVFETGDYRPTMRGEADYTARPDVPAATDIDVPTTGAVRKPAARGAYGEELYERTAPDLPDVPQEQLDAMPDIEGRGPRTEPIPQNREIYPEDRPREMYDPELTPGRGQSEANLDYIDPETGRLESRPQMEARPEAPWDRERVVVDEGAGLRAEGIDLDRLTERVVRVIASERVMNRDEMITELRRYAGEIYKNRVMLTIRDGFEAVRNNPEAGRLAQSLGVDWHQGAKQLLQFEKTGNPALLGDDAFGLIAVGNLVRHGADGYGELLVDQAHYLTRELEELARTEITRLAKARGIELEEMGVREIADDSLTAAAAFVTESGKATKASLRKKFDLTNGQAERMMEQLEAQGVVTPKTASGRRSVVPGGGQQTSLMDRMGAMGVGQPGHVQLYPDEHIMMRTILGEDTPHVLSLEKIEEVLEQRRGALAAVEAELVKYRKASDAARADRIAAATGQKVVRKVKGGEIVSGVTTYRQLRGDIFNNLEHADAIVVTTNGYVGRNGAVMGAGIAKTVADAHPEIKANLTRHLKENGNVVGVIGEIDGKPVIAMPVKPAWGTELTSYNAAKENPIKPNKAGLYMGWATKADPALIEQSTHELLALVEELGLSHVMMPRPGAGAGDLPFKRTGAWLNGMLDERFIIADQKGRVFNDAREAVNAPITQTAYGRNIEGWINTGRPRSDGAVGKRSGMDFGNPYPVSDPDAVAKYREYLLDKVAKNQDFSDDVADLSGKKLLCPGAARSHTNGCHTKVLAEVADDLAAKRAVPESGGQVVQMPDTFKDLRDQLPPMSVSPELKKIDADLARLKKQMDAAGADSKQKTQALNDILENKAPDEAAPKRPAKPWNQMSNEERLAATRGSATPQLMPQRVERMAVEIAELKAAKGHKALFSNPEEFMDQDARAADLIAERLGKSITPDQLKDEMKTVFDIDMEERHVEILWYLIDPELRMPKPEQVVAPKKGGVDPRLGPAKKAADAAGDEINRLHAIRDEMFSRRKKLVSDAQIAEIAPEAPVHGQVVTDTPGEAPPIVVAPTPEGRAAITAAKEKLITAQNEIRRLETMAKRSKPELGTLDGEKVADEAFGVGPSPLPRDIGSSLRGWTIKHANEIARLGDPNLTLDIGRSTRKELNELGYEPGFLSSPFIYGMDRGAFEARWRGKRHPMLGQVTSGPVEGINEWAFSENNIKYAYVNSELEAAALFHETLWDFIEANPDEAKRIARWLTEKKPNLYIMQAKGTTAEVDVVAEAFALVEYGITKRPSNRWANLRAGQASGKHAEWSEKLGAEVLKVKEEVSRRVDEVDRITDDIEEEIVKRTIDTDDALKGELVDLLREVAGREPRAVQRWLARSAEVEALVKMHYGPDASVTAVLQDGDPLIQIRFPGDVEAGIERLDEGGLQAVVRRMMLDPTNEAHITKKQAVKELGPEMVQLFEAAETLKRARQTLQEAQISPKVPGKAKPTNERIVALEAAEEDYDTLMRLVWSAVSSRKPKALREFVWNQVGDELIPTEAWTRIKNVLDEHDPALLEQIQDFIRMGVAADMPMKNAAWKRRVHGWMKTMRSMNTEDTSIFTGHYLEETMQVVTDMPRVGLTTSQLDDMIFSVEAMMADAFQALSYAAEYKPIAREILEGFTGPLKEMVNNFQEAARKLPPDEAGQRAALIDNLKAMKAWFDNTQVSPEWHRAVDYAYVGTKGGAANTRRFETRVNTLKNSLEMMLSHDAATQVELRGTMVPAGKLDLGGDAAGMVIDYALGRELAMTSGRIRTATQDRNLRHLMRTSQGVWAWWRRAATISRPSFHIRNFIGGMFNNTLIGVNPGTYFTLGPDVLIYQRKFNQARHLITNSANPEQSFYENVLVHVSKKNRDLFYGIWKHEVLSTAFVRGDLGKLPGRTWVKPWQANWVPFQAGGTAMESVEGLLRVAAFAKYYDPAIPHLSGRYAKEMVHAVHFDYVNLTPLEERIKKWVPFYVWSRRNIPLQIRTMMQSPRYMITVNKARKLWNEEFTDEDDEGLGGMGFVLPFSRDNELGWAHLMWMPDLPMMDVFDSPLFTGTQMGPTPFGTDFKNPQAWALYGMQLAGPAATIPYDFMKEDDRTTNAPTGVNELLALGAALMGKEISSSGDVKIPWFANSAFNSMIPFYHDYRAATGAQSNNPYRAAREGMLPGEQKMVNVPGDNMALGAMRTFGRGAGFSWATPMDAFFANRDIERLIDEYRYRVQTRMPEASMSQVAELEAAQSAGY